MALKFHISCLEWWVSEQARKRRETGLAARLSFGPDKCRASLLCLATSPSTLAPDWSPDSMCSSRLTCLLSPSCRGPLMGPSLSKGDDWGFLLSPLVHVLHYTSTAEVSLLRCRAAGCPRRPRGPGATCVLCPIQLFPCLKRMLALHLTKRAEADSRCFCVASHSSPWISPPYYTLSVFMNCQPGRLSSPPCSPSFLFECVSSVSQLFGKLYIFSL